MPLQFEWPEVEKGSGMRETKMIYKFDYLPAGLFNRGQVGSVPSFTDLDMGVCLPSRSRCCCLGMIASVAIKSM